MNKALSNILIYPGPIHIPTRSMYTLKVSLSRSPRFLASSATIPSLPIHSKKSKKKKAPTHYFIRYFAACST